MKHLQTFEKMSPAEKNYEKLEKEQKAAEELNHKKEMILDKFLEDPIKVAEAMGSDAFSLWDGGFNGRMKLENMNLKNVDKLLKKI